jgi:beta-RFAP synthase
MAVSHLFGLALDARTVAQLLDRGARSGIGVGAFEHGGFLVDGGKGAADQAPPLVSHMVFPQEWRVLLIFDDACQGVHGTREARAFQDLASFPESTAAHLCRLVMMRALPALAEKNLSDFGQAIRFLQHVVGDYFSGVQGGRFASHAVVQVLAWLEDNGVGAVGQSSWGPTGFAVLESEVRARSVLKKIPVHWRDNNALHFKVCCARNRGGDVLIDKASQQRERKIG